MKKADLLRMLSGGNRRSIGQSEQVAAEVLANPPLFGALITGMMSRDPLVRMRAADAAEKVTRHNPALLQRHRKIVLKNIAKSDQQEVRWHVAQLLSRIDWTRAERAVVLSTLQEYIKDKSSIVRTFAMQAMAEQAEKDSRIRSSIIKQIRMLTETGTPAMKSRGKKLLARLERS